MKKKRKIGNIILTVVLLGIAALLVLIPFWMERTAGKTKDGVSIRTATVERNTITATIAGSGSITDDDAVEVTVPEGVKLTEYVVENGDTVQTGDPLAIVDVTSVMNVITDVRSDLDEIEKEMASAQRSTAETDLKTDVAGRVKLVCANAGDSVRAVMDTRGALAVVSLDGLMVTTVETNVPFSIGETVTVIREDGVTELSGTVELVRGGAVTVTVTDEGTLIGETVTVLGADGAPAGSGTLDVHSAWNVTAWSGTVKLVKCKPEQTVKAGALLFRLEDTDYASDYKQLSDKHRDYEELMFDLFKLYADGLVLSEADGKIDGIDKDNKDILLTGARRSGLTLTRLSTRGSDALLSINSPDPNDEDRDYTNYQAVVTAKNEDGTYTIMRSASPVAVADYASLSAPALAGLTVQDTAALSVFYKWSGSAWETASAVSVGDTFVFVLDGDRPLWAIYSGKSSEIPTDPTGDDEPTEPGGEDPDDPGGKDPTDPTDPTDPVNPFGPGSWSGRIPHFSFSRYSIQQEEHEYTSLDRVTVMSVIPQDKVTVTMSIDELDILSVSLGQKAQVTLDAVPGQSFEGTVTKIETTGSNAGGNSKFTVTMELDRTAQMIGGMNVSALLTVGSHENVLTLPSEALTEEGTKVFVYTVYDEENGLSGKQEVTTGASDGLITEIVSNLKEGDTVRYAYYDTLESERNLSGSAAGSWNFGGFSSGGNSGFSGGGNADGFSGGRNTGNDQPGGRQ